MCYLVKNTFDFEGKIEGQRRMFDLNMPLKHSRSNWHGDNRIIVHAVVGS